MSGKFDTLNITHCCWCKHAEFVGLRLCAMQAPEDWQPEGLDSAAGLAQELAQVSAQVIHTNKANASLLQQLQTQLLQCQSLAAQVQQSQWAGLCT